MEIFAPRLSEKLIFEGQRATKVRKSLVFCVLKSWPDLGVVSRSILANFGSHFGSILVMKTISKIDAKNNSGKLRKITNFCAKIASPLPKKPLKLHHAFWCADRVGSLYIAELSVTQLQSAEAASRRRSPLSDIQDLFGKCSGKIRDLFDIYSRHIREM